MTVIAPAISPDLIIACASSSGHPAHFGRLVSFRFSGNLRARRDVQVLGVVSVADQGLVSALHVQPEHPAGAAVRGRPWKTDGYTDRPNGPDPVRYTSVVPRIQRHPPLQGGTLRHRDETAR